jgi:hypothetical protein
VVLVLALAPSACVRSLNIPRPSGGLGGPPPPLPVSRIDLPISVGLAAALAQMEAQVPVDIDRMGQWTPVAGTPVSVRYRVHRTPFAFSVRNGALHAESTLGVSAEACLTAPLVGALTGCQPVASCGIGEAPRQVVVSVDTSLRLDPQWRLVAETRAGEPVFRDRCQVTMFRIDVTDQIAGIVSTHVAEAARGVDAMIAQRGDLRPHAETLWRALQDPVDLGEGFWLTVRPEAVRASPLAVDASSLRTVLAVAARPQVVSGARPTMTSSTLPTLGEVEGESGFRVTLDAVVSFAEATRMLVSSLRGTTIDMNGQQVLVRDIRVEGRGGALLFAMDIRFASGQFMDTEGTVYLAGLPYYEANTGMIAVRQVDYTLETRNSLLRIGEWMNQGAIREALARRARWPISTRIEHLRQRASAGLERALGGGAMLHGRLDAVRPDGVYVTDAGIVLRVVADGRAEITQDVSAILGSGNGGSGSGGDAAR